MPGHCLPRVFDGQSISSRIYSSMWVRQKPMNIKGETYAEYPWYQDADWVKWTFLVESALGRPPGCHDAGTGEANPPMPTLRRSIACSTIQNSSPPVQFSSVSSNSSANVITELVRNIPVEATEGLGHKFFRITISSSWVHHLTSSNKSGFKHWNTLGCLHQYMAQHGHIVKQSYCETI